MDLQFNEMLSQVTQFLEHEASTETVIGQPFTLGEFSCIPVVRVGMGFGTGGNEAEATTKPTPGRGEAGGAGAGMGISPLGFLVSRGEEIQFISTQQNKGLSAAFEKVPDLISRYLDQREKAAAS
ncbi:MAG: GerW family sporulation protein [Bacteroidota bacterium]